MPLFLRDRLSRLPGAALDYVALIFAAFIGMLVVVAAMLWANPNPDEVVNSGQPLIVAATLVVMALFWFGPGRRFWFAGRRLFRGVALAAIAGAGLFVWLWVRALQPSDTHVGGSTELFWMGVQLQALLLILTGLFVLRRRGLKQGWWSRGLRAGLVAAVVMGVVYLKWDEPVALIVASNCAELAGSNEDEATYRLTLRYTPAPRGGGKSFEAPKKKLSIPADGAKRRDYLLAHRSEIEANQAELADVRVWWAEMAAHDSLGDRSEWDMEQPLIRFSPIRAYQQTELALAELEAIDGDGDGALMRVMDVYKVGANLEPATCTLVRGMIAVVVQKEALRSARFVLDNAEVSAGVRGRFADILAAAPESGSGLRRMMLSEAMYASSAIRNISRFSWGRSLDGWHVTLATRCAMVFRWLAFNEQATINRMHEQLGRIGILAARRELETLRELDTKMNEQQLGGFQVKNLGGRMMVPMIAPIFGGVAKSYWEKEDARENLLRRLRPAAADGSPGSG